MKLFRFPLLGLLTIIIFSLTSCDPCKDVTCNNGGTCNEGKCECPAGTEGNMCETAWRDALLGTYNGGRTCEGVDQKEKQVTLSADPIAGQILVGYGTNEPIICVMTSPNSFTYSQNFAGEEYSTTGTVSGNQLTLTERTKSTFGTINCTFTGTR